MKTPIIVAYGGGVNSTAMLVEMIRRRTDVPLGVIFSDTGGERPETYATVKMVSQWLQSKGWNPILTVRNAGPTIEEDCNRRKTLPAIAFGFKTCSDRWKARPFNRWVKDNLRGGPYLKAIGFDADEDRRVRASKDPGCTNWFPLVDWGLHREDCEEICRSAGLPIAKSACFFCRP